MIALLPKPRFSANHDVNNDVLRLIEFMADHPYSPRVLTIQQVLERVHGWHGKRAADEVADNIGWPN